MAKEDSTWQSRYNKAEHFIERHQNLVTTVLAVVVLGIGGYYAYQEFYLAPLQEEAQKQIFRAQRYFRNDSLQLAINGDGNYPGFKTIAQEYDGTKPGNLAHYYLGLSYLHLGNYQSAQNHLKQFESNDFYYKTISLGALGDAYIELGQKQKAAKYYKKAANRKSNKFTSPIYLFRAGLALEEVGKAKEAKQLYEKIKYQYPESNQAQEIDKYIARAEAQLQHNTSDES